jgi:hypothetical protein
MQEAQTFTDGRDEPGHDDVDGSWPMIVGISRLLFDPGMG